MTREHERLIGRLFDRLFIDMGLVPTYVYRLFGADDELLYIGCTAHLGDRFIQHKQQKPWWREVRRFEKVGYTVRAEALAAELEAIRTERPKYNVVGNPDWLISSAQEYGIVISDEWQELGYETYTAWYVDRLWPLMQSLGVRPTLQAAVGVLQRIRADQAALPPAQRRPKRELAALVGVSDKTLQRIDRMTT